MTERRDFNEGLNSGLRQSAQELAFEIMLLEQKVLHARNMRALVGNPDWVLVAKSLIELERLTMEELATKKADEYRQGRMHGIIFVVRMLLRAPILAEEEVEKIEKKEIPALRESLDTCRRLLGAQPITANGAATKWQT